MIKKTVFSSLLVLSMLSIVMPASGETLCLREEIMIASCQIHEKKARTLSICSTSDKKSIVYRFGKKPNVEMIALFSKNNRMSRWLDVGTYTTYFGFKRGAYGYSFGVPQETYEAKAFLDITKEDKLIRSAQCTSNSYGEKTLSNDAFYEVPDSAVRDNDFLFPSDA